MIDASNRVEFVHPRMLQIETARPFPFRFRQVVLIWRVVERHGGNVNILVEGHQYDARSPFEIIKSLGFRESLRCFAFIGEEAALNDLGRLCRHMLIDGKNDSIPDELGYLR